MHVQVCTASSDDQHARLVPKRAGALFCCVVRMSWRRAASRLVTGLQAFPDRQSFALSTTETAALHATTHVVYARRLDMHLSPNSAVASTGRRLRFAPDAVPTPLEPALDADASPGSGHGSKLSQPSRTPCLAMTRLLCGNTTSCGAGGTLRGEEQQPDTPCRTVR
jgi:hypothetical protein